MRTLFAGSRPRFGLLTRFALAGLAAIAVLGVVLAHALAQGVRTRALADARRTARLIDTSLVQPRLTAHDLDSGLSPQRVRALDRTLWASVARRADRARSRSGTAKAA